MAIDRFSELSDVSRINQCVYETVSEQTYSGVAARLAVVVAFYAGNTICPGTITNYAAVTQLSISLWVDVRSQEEWR